MPKSRILTVSPRVIMRLPGLTSRWTMSSSCAAASPRAGLDRDRQRPLGRERAAREDAVERLALVVRHRDEDVPAGVSSTSKIVQMFGWSSEEAARASRTSRCRSAASAGAQELQRDVPPEPEVGRPVDVAHPAGAEQFANLVVRDGPSRVKVHRHARQDRAPAARRPRTPPSP